MYDVFARPRTLFRALAAAAGAEPARLVLHRFEGAHGPSALHVVDVDERAAHRYDAEGYAAAYLVFSSPPQSETDWAFLAREESSIIELTGGHTREGRLEIARIRALAKSSAVAGVLRRITAQLDPQCTRGVLLAGRPYPKVRVEKGLSAEMSLWWDLDDDRMQALPLSTTA